MVALKFLAFTVIWVLVTFNFFLIGWNKGFDTGYGAGIVNVYLGVENPWQYIARKENLKPILKKAIIEHGKQDH